MIPGNGIKTIPYSKKLEKGSKRKITENNEGLDG